MNREQANKLVLFVLEENGYSNDHIVDPNKDYIRRWFKYYDKKNMSYQTENFTDEEDFFFLFTPLDEGSKYRVTMYVDSPVKEIRNDPIPFGDYNIDENGIQPL